MKTLFALLLLGTVSAQAVNLTCVTPTKIYGWTGTDTNEKMYLTAIVVTDNELKNAEISGAFNSDSRDLKAQPRYQNVNPRYDNYNKFSLLEDAWKWFYILLPKNFTSLNRSFTGYVQIENEEGGVRTERVFCSVK